MESLRVDDDRIPYPDSTTDFVKVLREMGFEVQFTEPREARRYVGHKAWEIWLPILKVAIEVLVALEAGLLVEIVKEFLPGGPSKEIESTEKSDPAKEATEPEPERALLHVDWRVAMPDGREERFVANGDAKEVLESLDDFERHVRDL